MMADGKTAKEQHRLCRWLVITSAHEHQLLQQHRSSTAPLAVPMHAFMELQAEELQCFRDYHSPGALPG
jgi:hypothetical protein